MSLLPTEPVSSLAPITAIEPGRKAYSRFRMVTDASLHPPAYGRHSLQWLNHHHSKCPDHIVMLLDRNVFSRDKPVIAKAVPALVVVRIAEQVVMKRPRPSGLANEMTDLIRIAAPEAPHAAAGAIGLPLAFADPSVVGKRRGEFVAPLAASIGKIVVARELQADFVKAHSGPPEELEPKNFKNNGRQQNRRALALTEIQRGRECRDDRWEEMTQRQTSILRRWRLVRDKLRTALVAPVRAVRLRYLSLLMIYYAYGALGLVTTLARYMSPWGKRLREPLPCSHHIFPGRS